MDLMHRLLTARIEFLSFFQQSSNISSQYQAFEEIIQLHDPPFYLYKNSNTIELNQFRSTAKQIFKSLYPQSNIQTCQIKPIKFTHNGRTVLSYSIQNGDMHDWTDPSQKFLLYIHGGGFVYGDIDIYSGYECYLSRKYHMPVIHIEYGLSPKYNVYWAIDDVVTVYMSMLKFDPYIHQRIIGMSDSSGGLLWLRLIQIIVERKQSVPLALVLLSPWVDISFNNIEYDNVTDQKRTLFSLQLVTNLREQAFNIDRNLIKFDYFKEYNKQLVKINPKEYSFKGFPPLYVIVGTQELFLWDAIILKNKILENNGQIILEEGYGLMHTYPMFHLWSSEAKCAQNKIRMFIEQF
ncbi:unnamed protein product [Rotaria sordida]|uniref:Alpha/beta hydrolase fold-3 domain-containing protein n=1 Tax=Rotaria sordida TaxID=392033 RepID=A0A815ADB6_9BILA|nr:unnamed protein product [Rotaria sordida]CAF3753083.1 unnamed protein product [Rotaria sordida]